MHVSACVCARFKCCGYTEQKETNSTWLKELSNPRLGFKNSFCICCYLSLSQLPKDRGRLWSVLIQRWSRSSWRLSDSLKVIVTADNNCQLLLRVYVNSGSVINTFRNLIPTTLPYSSYRYRCHFTDNKTEIKDLDNVRRVPEVESGKPGWHLPSPVLAAVHLPWHRTLWPISWRPETHTRLRLQVQTSFTWTCSLSDIVSKEKKRWCVRRRVVQRMHLRCLGDGWWNPDCL